MYCIIVGFGLVARPKKKLYIYDTVKSDPHEAIVQNINPYLVDGPNIVIRNRQNPLSKVPNIAFGNMPRDGGNLIIDRVERDSLIAKYTFAEKYIRLYI